MKNLNYKDIFLIPNILSSIRLLLVIVAIYLFTDLETNRIALFGVAIFSIILDNLDGYFARKLNQITELGKIIDPLADKLMMGVCTVGLFLNHKITLLMFSVIVFRDLVIMFGSLLYSGKSEVVLPSNKLGKWTAGVIAVYLLLVLSEISLPGFILNTINFILIILISLNLINYGQRAIKLLK